MKFLRSLLFFVLALATLPGALAQPAAWPASPVRIVVTFPPGGLTDRIARLLSDGLAKEFGQPFLVDNRPGAGGTIGIGNVVNAAPDGTTIVVLPASYAIVPSIYKDLPFDPIKGIAPVGMIATSPFVVVAHPSLKAANLKEMLDHLRANPGTVNYGSAGVGTDLHLGLELFQQMSGTRMVHVPYKGIGPAVTDLLSGRIQVMLSTPLSVAGHLKSGKLRALAVTADRRLPDMPELPAVTELVPGYTMTAWWGVGATAGTPADVVARLNQAIGRVLAQPEIQAQLRSGGAEPAHSSPEAFGRLIAQDQARWAQVIRSGNIRVD